LRAVVVSSSVGCRLEEEDSTVPKQQAPGLEHGGLKADLTHIHVRHSSLTALLTQLPAPPSDPGGSLAELPTGGAVVLRLGPGSRRGPRPRTSRAPGSTRGPRCARAQPAGVRGKTGIVRSPQSGSTPSPRRTPRPPARVVATHRSIMSLVDPFPLAGRCAGRDRGGRHGLMYSSISRSWRSRSRESPTPSRYMATSRGERAGDVRTVAAPAGWGTPTRQPGTTARPAPGGRQTRSSPPSRRGGGTARSAPCPWRGSSTIGATAGPRNGSTEGPAAGRLQ
jgi:hypothetical protein